MRAFLAVDLDDQFRTFVGGEQTRLQRVLDGERLSWVRSEHVHLTLLFLPDIDEQLADRLFDALSKGIRCAPFRLEVGGFGLFPAHGAPRVLWLAVVGGAPQVCELHREVAACGQRVGVAAEAGTFRPHVTLGRWRIRTRRSVRAKIERMADNPVMGGEVSSVTAYESKLTAHGPIHTPRATGALTWR